jgi:hypothetical protein
MFIEAHEEFVQHIEAGQRRIRSLSIITFIVAIFLSGSYVLQLVYPLLFGQSVVTVNLSDPMLIALEVVGLILTLSWILVAGLDYRFADGLGKRVKAARVAEKELERKLQPTAP